MQFLINPDVSYVLLILGFLIAILALFAPGTGLLEMAALITLALAAYGIVNLPINAWAFAVMALGLIPLGLALGPMKRPMPRQRTLMVILSILAFLLGAALLYRGAGWLPAVSPLLILMLSPLVVGLAWLVAAKTIAAGKIRPSFSLDRLVGMTGKVTSDIRDHQGTVYVDGEEWSAVGKGFIPAGTPVRIVRRDGLALEVERLER